MLTQVGRVSTNGEREKEGKEGKGREGERDGQN